MNKNKWRIGVGIFVYLVLLFSIFFSIFKIITTPAAMENLAAGDHVRSDYVLMLVQCCLGLVVIGIPSALSRKFSFELPNAMTIAYFIFLFCAIYLGEVRKFYYLIPFWDDILHYFSGAMLGAFGFSLVKILNDSDRVRVELNPYFICLFAFCFALAAGAVWEIYEYLGDTLFGMNMQKYRLSDGTLLVGSAALRDTMRDLIIDTCGALIVVIAGLLHLKGSEHLKKRKKETEQHP